MLNEERVRLMTRMAAYEDGKGREDMKISRYYRKDYASLHTLITILWLTFGYAALIGLIGIAYMEPLMKNLTLTKLILLGCVIVGIYLILVVVYGASASNIYKNRHGRAKQRVKQYYRDLSRLKKMYEKEKK
ncbi:MAG: hypothetical protein PHN80_07025 [Hespellia sp.]|nr:hypothetical protein [Hespellia sp.]